MPIMMANGVLMICTSGSPSDCRNILIRPCFSKMVCQAIVVSSEFIQRGSKKSKNTNSPRFSLRSRRIRHSG